MKKLLLHIGYPKTATTTLQESVFKKLFKLEKINYLNKSLLARGFCKQKILNYTV